MQNILTIFEPKLSIIMSKIVYIDLDNTLVNFDSGTGKMPDEIRMSSLCRRVICDLNV